jgi:glutamine amidotransferase-like protein
VGSGIAGVYDLRSGFDADATQGAFEPWESASAVSTGAFTAARAPAGDGADETAPVLCLLAGRIHNLDLVAREVGCAADLPAERVLATGYTSRGEELLGILRGSFVLLLWNRHERRGIAAQDQVANRTLYYANVGRRLFFVSDVAPLLRVLPRRPGTSASHSSIGSRTARPPSR